VRRISKKKMSKLEIINKEINTEIANVEVQKALLATTFKGLDILHMKQALLEGMMRGFEFKDFLEKNIYAVPFGSNYSLVTSIDYARKVGMRSGVVGKSAPEYAEKDGKLVSCTITIKRASNGLIGEYTATVYFDEYTTNRNLWTTKPRTMIAKVAEMHALRMACPEEMSQIYTEEELESEKKKAPDVSNYRARLEGSTNLDELADAWESLPTEAKTELNSLKDELKAKYENTKV
jgi:hypothetical protein